jgi:nuclear pore complex protein Nup93
LSGLRCGDALAAFQTVQAVSRSGQEQSGVEPSVWELLSHLARHQSSLSGGDNDFVWAAAGNSNTAGLTIPDHVQKEVDELYQRTSSRLSTTTSTAANISQIESFKLATLALLCQSNDETTGGTSGVEETIEDYLFTKLWVAVSGTCTGKINDVTPPIAQLGTLIQHWGPKYFESGEDSSNLHSGGWAYAMPLLIAQQFETALTHLASVGGPLGLLQACHLGIVLETAKVSMRDLGPDGDNNDDEDKRGSNLYASLLTSYSRWIKNADPPAALEYLVRIPDETTMRVEIQRLILSTRAFDVLVGIVSATGVREYHGISPSAVTGERREGAALDGHFAPSQVSALLDETAELALKEGNMEDAAELMSRAGSYGQLIALFNQQLGDLLVKIDGGEMESKRK